MPVNASLALMIIRPVGSSQQLITQPAHAALAARIMREWQPGHFPDSPRKASILHAIEQHDCGWAEFDAAPAMDEATGRLHDFITLPDALKRDASLRGVHQLAADPYAAALSAQHRLHVYRRRSENPEWRDFFASLTAARESYLRAAGSGSLDDLLRDYTFVRAGDLASLALCNNEADIGPGECGYAMRLEGLALLISPDPFGGRTIEIEVEAREINQQTFAPGAEARRVIAAAPAVALKGSVRGVDEF